MITVNRSFMPTDRYFFDAGKCSYANGYAQIDTRQDASYFGIWASPTERRIFCYCEGDITVQTGDTDEEFVKMIRECAEFYNNHGYGPVKIDALANQQLAKSFQVLGLSDLLH